MRYTLIGMNQEKAIELGLDLTDLCILKWIQEALARPNMSRILEDENIYVWMDYQTFIEDYPIVNIKQNMLSKRMNKLIEKGLVKRKQIANKNSRGSRCYFMQTELFESLIYKTRPDVIDYTCSTTTSNELHMKTRPDVIDYTSNLYTNNTYIENTKSNNIEFLGTLPKNDKPKKDNLYTKCVSLVNEFTDNEELRSMLVQYLNLLLEMKKLRGFNQWKGMVNNTLVKSLKESDSDIDYIDIVQYSIDHAYCTFYPRKNSYSNNYSRSTINKSQNVKYPEGHKVETDMDKWKEEQEEMRRSGKQTKF